MRDVDNAEHWFTECEKCRRMFRDGPAVAGVCQCGHENAFVDE